MSFVVWLLVTRSLKYMPHLVKRPQDMMWMPVWILFGYYFALMKIYCLLTLHVTEWGTRKGADHKEKLVEDLGIFTPHWQDSVTAYDKKRKIK